jgi:hypothetical protein
MSSAVGVKSMRLLKYLRTLAASLGFGIPELTIALVLLVAALGCAWPEAEGMATSSLWQDELYTIDQFSSNGAAFVLTHYNTNNHIFFNLLSSLHSWDDRYDPLLARSWSFVFAILTVVSALGYHVLRGRLFEGSAQAFLLLTNVRMLDLVLQARGYGFLALAALLCTLLAWDYFRHKSHVALVAMPIAVFLGTWTVPTFVLFGGSLLVAMLVYSRDLRWLLSGGATLLLICIVYWPVRLELLRDIVAYAGLYGREFANWNAISDLFSKYMFFGSSAWLTLLLLISVMVALSHSRIRKARSKASVCTGFCIIFTLVVCLEMQTPPERTVAYLVIPFGFVLITVLTDPLRRPSARKVRLGTMTLIMFAALAFSWHFYRTFRFLPIEAWRETAHLVEKRFPNGTEVVATFRPERLKAYLKEDYPIVQKLDLQKFSVGRQIVVDSAFWAKSRFPAGVLPKGYQTETVPQRRGGMQRIYFMP